MENFSSKMKVVLVIWIVLFYLTDSSLGRRDKLPSSEDLRKMLVKFKSDMDHTFEHNSVSLGVDADREAVDIEERNLIIESDVHDIIEGPPFVGSYCDYNGYKSLIGPYYASSFLRQDHRLFYNRRIIEEFRSRAGDTYAWNLCQYGKIKLECSEDSRCECLSEPPPDSYVETANLTCVGAEGSICTTNPIATIGCIEGVECIDGYCGGIEALEKILLGSGSIRIKIGYLVWFLYALFRFLY